MTVTALTPFAAAAGLVLAAGTLTFALAAEQPAGTPPAANSPVANPPAISSQVAPSAPTTPAGGVDPTRAGASNPAANGAANRAGTDPNVPRSGQGQPTTGPSSRVQGGAPNTTVGLNGNADPLAALLAKPVNLDFQDTPLVEAITFIEKASGIDIVFEPAEVANATVSLKVERMPLGRALLTIETLTGLTHAVQQNGSYRIRRP